MKIPPLALLFAAAALVSNAATPAPVERDIVIYGASSAGIAAAVQAKRMGKSVVIVEPSERIGGLTTGGLGQTDIGNQQVIGGISREFYRAVAEHYASSSAWTRETREETRIPNNRLNGEGGTMWVFEPSVALNIYEGWVNRDNLEIIKNERLDRVNGAVWATSSGKRLAAFRTESGLEFRGKVFIDASYEGDLMALLGVRYTVGREANALYDETLNGVQTVKSTNHQLTGGVDPYVIKGDPSSGLIHFVDPTGPGEEGAGDHRVQAYCFRMCLTDHPDNRIPFAKPENYQEEWYELLFRNYEAGASTSQPPWINSPMPNRKTDTNNRWGFSTDFIGQNYDYPEADYETREAIVQRHLLYQQGLMWTLANHPRVPKKVRDEVSKWGMTKDEFAETGGWQKQLYIREARRMIGKRVMTQHHCQGSEVVDDSIGMAAYQMDSHNTQRYVNADGYVRNEGNIEEKGFPPYPVGYSSLVPKQSECENLLVPIAMSASHIAYGSIRMEPVFMIFGQSAASAAAFAIDDEVPVQQVNYEKLRARLLDDKQILGGWEVPGLGNALKTLNTLGIISSPTHWLKNARPGSTCEGHLVASIIISTVAFKINPAPTPTLEEACDYLVSQGVMTEKRAGDWKKFAQKGKTCTGTGVSGLILDLAAFISPPAPPLPPDLTEDELLHYALAPSTDNNGSTAHLPKIEINPDTQLLQISFTPIRPELNYTVQSSTDLLNWTDVYRSSSSDINQLITVSAPSSGSAASLFLRLKVTLPQEQ